MKDRYESNNKIYPIGEILGSFANILKNSIKNNSNTQTIDQFIKNNPLFVEKLEDGKLYIPSKPNLIDKDATWKSRIYKESIAIYRNMINLGGVRINKIRLKTESGVVNLYSPRFESLLTLNTSLPTFYDFVVKIENMDGKVGFGSNDFRKGSEELIKQMNLVNSEGIKTPRADLDKYLKSYFTWHHYESLDEMVLIPKKCHNNLKHWGARKILEKTNDNKSLREKWRSNISYVI